MVQNITIIRWFFFVKHFPFLKKFILCQHLFLFLYFFLSNPLLLGQVSNIRVSLVPCVTVAHGEAGVGLHGEVARLATPVNRGLSCTCYTAPSPPNAGQATHGSSHAAPTSAHICQSTAFSSRNTWLVDAGQASTSFPQDCHIRTSNWSDSLIVTRVHNCFASFFLLCSCLVSLCWRWPEGIIAVEGSLW